MSEAPRQGLGVFFGNILEFLDTRKARQEVEPLVGEETRNLMAAPPRSLAFMPSKAIDEIEDAIHRRFGEQALVDLGIFSGTKLGGTMVQPVLRAAFYLFGQTPAAAFANLDRFFALVTRGIRFAWRSAGEREGTVEARFDGPDCPTAAFHVLRGTLLYVYEVVGQPGQVDPPEVIESSPAGTLVRYRVRW